MLLSYSAFPVCRSGNSLSHKHRNSASILVGLGRAWVAPTGRHLTLVESCRSTGELAFSLISSSALLIVRLLIWSPRRLRSVGTVCNDLWGIRKLINEGRSLSHYENDLRNKRVDLQLLAMRPKYIRSETMSVMDRSACETTTVLGILCSHMVSMTWYIWFYHLERLCGDHRFILSLVTPVPISLRVRYG